MSILNGTVSREVIHADGGAYGEALTEVGFLPLDGAFDCTALDDSTLVCACRGRLVLYTVPGLTRLAVLDGIGTSRQICCDSGIAYVTTRENGVYICDLRRPSEPRLLAHIDTLELATGVSAAGEVRAAHSQPGLDRRKTPGRGTAPQGLRLRPSAGL